MYKKILIAYDGSEGSRKAMMRSIELAACFDAEFHSISVEEDLPQYVATIGEFEEVKRQKDAFFEELNREAVEQAKAGGAKLTPHIVVGHEVESLDRASRHESLVELVARAPQEAAAEDDGGRPGPCPPFAVPARPPDEEAEQEEPRGVLELVGSRKEGEGRRETSP